MEQDYGIERRLAGLSPELHGRYRDCVVISQRMLCRYENYFPDFTDHTVLHTLDILELCNQLICSQLEKLNAQELYVLLMGALFHDVGMGVSVPDFEQFRKALGVPEPADDTARAWAVRDHHQELSGLYLGKYGHLYTASPDINTEDFQASVDFLSVQDHVDPERIGILGICGWGGLALNTVAIDTRIKATVVSTMYDMSRIAAKGYFDSADSEEARHQARKTFSDARTAICRSGDYGRAGGCLPLTVAQDVPFFVKDYSEYYKGRAYHARSLNSNEGWNTIGTLSFLNQPILCYTNEIRSAVLVIHGEKAHSCYMGREAYAHMMEGNPNPENKELVIIPGAVHTDLYDNLDVIPFDKIQDFFKTYLK